MTGRERRDDDGNDDGPRIEASGPAHSSEELIMLVVEELEARVKAASSLALNLRLAAGMAPTEPGVTDADFEARVGELLLQAHLLLAGDGCSLAHENSKRELDPYDGLPAVLRPPPSSRPLRIPSRRRMTPAQGTPPPSSRERFSSGPPPADSGIRKRRSLTPRGDRPAASASEPTPRGFATNDLQRWYESLTKSTRG